MKYGIGARIRRGLRAEVLPRDQGSWLPGRVIGLGRRGLGSGGLGMGLLRIVLIVWIGFRRNKYVFISWRMFSYSEVDLLG